LALTVIGSTLILIFSGFEDCMYIFLNGGFPPNDVNWNWMWQAKLFWFWGTTNQIEWTIISHVIYGFHDEIHEKVAVATKLTKTFNWRPKKYFWKTFYP
jgi:hypothetical protein